MKRINPFQFGFSVGITAVLFYAACVILMLSFSEEQIVAFLNLLFHGFDVTSIFKLHPPLSNDFIGAFLTFLISFLFASTVASLYNFLLKEDPET